jgi:hypothetical protein
MKIDFKRFIGRTIGFDGFTLTARDAYDTAKNIEAILRRRGGFFRKPTPMPIGELKQTYRTELPLMDVHFPGHIDKMIRPEILRQLGFIVDLEGNVSLG